ncbi:ectoine synthase [Mycetohabitans sp. B5]|uniref:L-ectoine synthase n=1 Tax=Mycetohabitans endofungorum TaxID=417203 RepID=A0A2P5K726_9BURK|nr:MULTISPECIES: ectoine synthase [Mycetohabitans]MCG1055171.1 ectoine synthase [Mycetohabitans sp. B5]PPB81011.1 ectoine synthase [Mycetohabitans endofungorum]
MIVRNLNELMKTDRHIPWGNGWSRRFLTEVDGMQFSLNDTIVEAGTSSLLEYRNHLEACYCISGTGQVRNAKTGETFDISPGTMYALDKNEAHYLIAHDELRLICVFSPALKGDERHDLSCANTASAY